MNLFVPALLLMSLLLACRPAAADPAGTGTSKGIGSAVSAEVLSIRRVYLVDLEGPVAPAMEEWLDGAAGTAEADPAGLLLLRIDTPGGLVSSMNVLVRRIGGSGRPVVAWVAPSGARAASAGAFLVQAASLAVMAPGTNIGSAHPVAVGGKDIGNNDLNRKIVNDLAARMRALAQRRGRNVAACAAMVERSASYSAREALRLGVVDLEAGSAASVLSGVNRRIVEIEGRPVRLDCSRYQVKSLAMPLRLQLLSFLSRPEVAYPALAAGLLALLLEIFLPGTFVPGTVGALLLLIGAYGMRVLPVNWAGVALLVAGVAIMAVDLAVGGGGLLAALGAGALALGGLLVYRAPGGELLNVPLHFMAGSLLVLGGFFVLAGWAVVRTLRRPPASGAEGILGASGVVREACDPRGMILVHGELWSALSRAGTIKEGEPVRVLRTEGLLAYVERVDPAGAAPGVSPEGPDSVDGETRRDPS
jgi:membrane-bound serine protease (ClpP class)